MFTEASSININWALECSYLPFMDAPHPSFPCLSVIPMTPTQLPQVLHTLLPWPEFKPSPGFFGPHPRAAYLSLLGDLQLAQNSLPSGTLADMPIYLAVGTGMSCPPSFCPQALFWGLDVGSPKA